MVELVLLMTVNPGFGGQKFLPEVLPKISVLRKLCVARGLTPWIEVDGGISPETIGSAHEAGADAFVAGSAVFGQRNYAAAIAALRAGAQYQ
jgi:ribulose-phosphate 3-epimerase